MADRLTIRRARPEDADQIALHRRLMFAEIFAFDPLKLNAMEADFRPWVRERLAQERYLGWLVVANNTKVVGGVGLWLLDWLPHPTDLTCQRGHVVDVYVQPDFRGQGWARRLMETLLDWCEDRGIITVTLSASPDGEHLYRSLGFEQTRILSKRLQNGEKADG